MPVSYTHLDVYKRQLTNGVILQQDNARPHVAQTIQDLLGRIKWKVLQHPPYSPDLSPSDYHVFGPLKKSIKGRQVQRFYAEVEFAVSEWFRKQPQ